jgi:hypothetical protein
MMRESSSKKGATSVDWVLGVTEIKLLNPKLSELVKIFTKQKKLHGLLQGASIYLIFFENTPRCFIKQRQSLV